MSIVKDFRARVRRRCLRAPETPDKLSPTFLPSRSAKALDDKRQLHRIDRSCGDGGPASTVRRQAHALRQAVPWAFTDITLGATAHG